MFSPILVHTLQQTAEQLEMTNNQLDILSNQHEGCIYCMKHIRVGVVISDQVPPVYEILFIRI